MIRVTLFSPDRGEEVGQVEFASLLLLNDDDCRCCPEGVLAPEELDVLCRQLRRLPQVNAGTVGPYRWREVG